MMLLCLAGVSEAMLEQLRKHVGKVVEQAEKDSAAKSVEVHSCCYIVDMS